MDYKALAEQIVKSARTRGADAAEAYLQAGRTLSIDVRNGAVETVEEAASQGVGVRVFVGGRMAFASCNDFAQAAIDNAVGRAIEFARSTTADPNNVLPGDAATPAVEGLYDPGIAKVPMERKIEMAIRLEALAMKDPRITKSGGAGYGEGEAEISWPTRMGFRRATGSRRARSVCRSWPRRESRSRRAGSRAHGGSSRTSRRLR